jgi:hypothetical protein
MPSAQSSGSEEDESDAQVFISAVNMENADTQLKDIAISHCKRKFENLPEV